MLAGISLILLRFGSWVADCECFNRLVTESHRWPNLSRNLFYLFVAFDSFKTLFPFLISVSSSD